MFKCYLYVRFRFYLYVRLIIVCLSVIYMLGELLFDLVVFYVGGSYVFCFSYCGYVCDFYGYIE